MSNFHTDMGCLRYFCSITKTVLATKRNVVPTSDGIRLLTCNSAYPVCLCQPIRVSMSSVEHSNCLQGQADVGSGAVFGTLPARKWQNIMALRAVLFMSSKIASKPNVGKEANKLDYHRRGSWIYVSLPHPYSRMLKDVAHSFIVPFQPTSLLGSSMSHWHHSSEHPLTSCNTHSRWYGRNGLREQIP